MNKNENKEKILAYSFKIFAVYFLYFSKFDTMKECGNIYFVMDYIFLLHEYAKMSQTYGN
jgi:hypothetical protein